MEFNPLPRWSEEERGLHMQRRCAISQRAYSREFKLSMIKLVIEDGKTPSQVCSEHPVSKSVLYSWLQSFDMRGEAAFRRYGPSQRKSNTLNMTMLSGGAGTVEACVAPQNAHESPETRIADLERLCGQLALENFLLKQRLVEREQSALEVVR